MINKVKYTEMQEEIVDINKEQAVNFCIEKLKDSLNATLSSDAQIVDYSSYAEDIENGKINVKVIFKLSKILLFKIYFYIKLEDEIKKR